MPTIVIPKAASEFQKTKLCATCWASEGAFAVKTAPVKVLDWVLLAGEPGLIDRQLAEECDRRAIPPKSIMMDVDPLSVM